jgi:hypothetical protein
MVNLENMPKVAKNYRKTAPKTKMILHIKNLEPNMPFSTLL